MSVEHNIPADTEPFVLDTSGLATDGAEVSPAPAQVTDAASASCDDTSDEVCISVLKPQVACLACVQLRGEEEEAFIHKQALALVEKRLACKASKSSKDGKG